MSYADLAPYISTSKYARHIEHLERRETWAESVDRMIRAHRAKYSEKQISDPELQDVQDAIVDGEILPSMRALQFLDEALIGRGQDQKVYNCCFSYVNRVEFFPESMMNLLCGSGVGASVQRQHVKQLPTIHKPKREHVESYVVPDSIEGWADAIGVCVRQYFVPGMPRVVFDFSEVRAKGSKISSGVGRAPGPDGLFKAIMKINGVFLSALEKGQTRLRTIDAYDVLMHLAEAVLSGGVRRSATICLFSADDEEMRDAKRGNWLDENPQRQFSNNSALILRSNPGPYWNVTEAIKAFGDPGFYFVDDLEHGTNPCAEIGLYAWDDMGNPGWQFCNLASVNMAKVRDGDHFLKLCQLAARVATLQAGYTDFAYLGDVSERITRREALIGISMTGMCQRGDFAFDPNLLRLGADAVKMENERMARKLGINPAARTTCVKPEGTGTMAIGALSSGAMALQSRRGIRNVIAKKTEHPAQHFAKHNPVGARERNEDDLVLSFPYELEGGIVADDESVADQLDKIMLIKRAWVDAGRRENMQASPGLSNNVSNTVNIRSDEEWAEAFETIFEARDVFGGIALFPSVGDLNFEHAPFVSVYDIDELKAMYGDDVVHEAVSLLIEEPFVELTRDPNKRSKVDEVALRLRDWHRWNDLRMQWQSVDYTTMQETDDSQITLNQTVACAGGACTL